MTRSTIVLDCLKLVLKLHHIFKIIDYTKCKNMYVCLRLLKWSSPDLPDFLLQLQLILKTMS